MGPFSCIYTTYILTIVKMTAFLPPNLFRLFKANPPLQYIAPIDVPTHQRKYPHKFSGIAQYVSGFEDPAETPAATRAETKDERTERKTQERLERSKLAIEKKLAEWDPYGNPNAVSDAYKTLFVGRLSYETTESHLKREMEAYGPIKSAKMVYDKKSGKPRGYAFVEFEHERDLNAAYKSADGRKVDGRRVVVDVERGRTVKVWRPRSLGGGLGGSRRGAPAVCLKYSGREDPKRDEEERDRHRSGDRERSPPRSEDRKSSRDDRSSRSDRDRSDRDRDRGSDRDRDRDRDRGRSDRGGREEGPKRTGHNANLEPLGSRRL